MPISPELLARSLQAFLAEARSGIVLEDEQVLFDLSSAGYSIASERGRCLLHLWSQERNAVREVLDLEQKPGVLRLKVRRFAQARPHKLEICTDRERRSAPAQKAARARYARVLERIIERDFPGWSAGPLSTTMDLERSLSPVYARGLVRRGSSAFAVLGVNAEESQSAVDGVLTFGLLWLDACRHKEAGSAVVEGLRLYVPPRSSATLKIRMAHLNDDAAKFQLVELDERDRSAREIDAKDLGNINTRLVRCPDNAQTRARFAHLTARVNELLPEAGIAVLSPSEVSFRLHGLEFAKARLASAPGTFQAQEELVFGLRGFETLLTDDTDQLFQEFLATVREARQVQSDRRDPLWRMYPERWLESLVFSNVAAVDARLDAAHVYEQVPAFSASDRAMIDLLTCTHDRRLAVLELKADEDIHLPLQGLDYWARVQWHHQRGEFREHGYFAGVDLAPEPPLLFLVAPSLRVHPSADAILRFYSPIIDWSLVGLDERWREGIKVVFRKGRSKSARA